MRSFGTFTQSTFVRGTPHRELLPASPARVRAARTANPRPRPLSQCSPLRVAHRTADGHWLIEQYVSFDYANRAGPVVVRFGLQQSHFQDSWQDLRLVHVLLGRGAAEYPKVIWRQAKVPEAAHVVLGLETLRPLELLRTSRIVTAGAGEPEPEPQTDRAVAVLRDHTSQPKLRVRRPRHPRTLSKSELHLRRTVPQARPAKGH